MTDSTPTIDAAASGTAAARTPGAGSWLRWTASAGFGLLYAFAIVIATFNLFAYTAAVGAGDARELTGLGWLVMILPIAFPAVIFLMAYVFSRRRRVWELSLVLLVGLTLVAVFWINLLLMQIRGDGLVV